MWLFSHIFVLNEKGSSTTGIVRKKASSFVSQDNKAYVVLIEKKSYSFFNFMYISLCVGYSFIVVYSRIRIFVLAVHITTKIQVSSIDKLRLKRWGLCSGSQKGKWDSIAANVKQYYLQSHFLLCSPTVLLLICYHVSNRIRSSLR